MLRPRSHPGLTVRPQNDARARNKRQMRLSFAQPMRVAFLKPPIGGILGLEMLTFVEPLCPICVAACLERDGHQCLVVDMRIASEEHGLADSSRWNPDIVRLQCTLPT